MTESYYYKEFLICQDSPGSFSVWKNGRKTFGHRFFHEAMDCEKFIDLSEAQRLATAPESCYQYPAPLSTEPAEDENGAAEADRMGEWMNEQADKQNEEHWNY